ncbi:hypothetical protein [Morganella morganii]|uniref:hypothetical protein n=1 Tax=Morganella morganii TaxID=582 RepID=UPI001644435F|nr:hypothetical protein [Morganella morganii]MBC3959666.1 hypothetical protein [Morganella morganii]
MNKEKIFIQISKYSLLAQLDDVEKYISQTSNRHDIDVTKLQQAYEEDKKDVPSEHIHQLDDYYSEQYDFLINIQSNMFNKSTLVSLYSCLEHNFNDFCNICQRIKGSNISVTDFNGDGIHKAKKYLTKLMSIDFSPSREWQFLMDFNKVRNCIVHANGDINKMTTAATLQFIVGNTKNLSLNNGNMIISSGYLIESIRQIEKFFCWLYSILETPSS